MALRHCDDCGHDLSDHVGLAAARESTNQFGFALIAMLGLLGLRISEATHADADDLGEEHGHRVLLVHGKGGKETLVPLPPAVGRAIDHAVGNRSAGPILLNRRARRMDRHCATRRLRQLVEAAIVRLPPLHPPPTTTHLCHHHARRRSRPPRRPNRRPARHPRTTMRYDRTRKNLDRHPNYILAAYMASAT